MQISEKMEALLGEYDEIPCLDSFIISRSKTTGTANGSFAEIVFQYDSRWVATLYSRGNSYTPILPVIL